MKVLLVGGGGREHALAWKIAQSPLVDELLCAPGSAAIARLGRCIPINGEDVQALADLAEREGVGLTVVGPEAPLVAGLADEFQARGLKVFGPTRAGAMLEGSKAFCKKLMLDSGVPTGRAEVVEEIEAARARLREWGAPVVIKADGLAAGKGVIICHTVEQAEQALTEMLVERRFGDAGGKVLIEECLVGEEVSFIAFTDGETILPLAGSQDHKRVGESDSGPNTGGMGAYSPVPVLDAALQDRVMREVMEPTVKGLKAAGIDFCGVLYAGLMICDGVPKVLEYNVRLGDPETQPLLFRLKSDLVPVMLAAVEGKLAGHALEWDERTAVCVVLAAEGYPGSYEKGRVISGLEALQGRDDAIAFHSGTALRDDAWVTAGGRVLGVTALGRGVAEAVQRAYEAVERISWDGMHYRRDIARRALERE